MRDAHRAGAARQPATRIPGHPGDDAAGDDAVRARTGTPAAPTGAGAVTRVTPAGRGAAGHVAAAVAARLTATRGPPHPAHTDGR
jgi:hypothetical protein